MQLRPSLSTQLSSRAHSGGELNSCNTHSRQLFQSVEIYAARTHMQTESIPGTSERVYFTFAPGATKPERITSQSRLQYHTHTQPECALLEYKYKWTLIIFAIPISLSCSYACCGEFILLHHKWSLYSGFFIRCFLDAAASRPDGCLI
jgi:hypothetical protein